MNFWEMLRVLLAALAALFALIQAEIEPPPLEEPPAMAETAPAPAEIKATPVPMAYPPGYWWPVGLPTPAPRPPGAGYPYP